MFCALIYAMNSGINSVWVAAENGLPHWIVSPEMSLVLELTVKQQALLYITVEEQSYAQSFPSPDLKSSVCACFVWLCSSVHASVCVFVRVLPSTVYQSMRRECLQGCQRRFKIFSLLSAPTHFSLCTAAQICKSVLLRMQSTRSASIYSFLLSPSQCTHSPHHAVPIPHPHHSLSAVSTLSLVLLFGQSCSVLWHMHTMENHRKVKRFLLSTFKPRRASLFQFCAKYKKCERLSLCTFPSTYLYLCVCVF